MHKLIQDSENTVFKVKIVLVFLLLFSGCWEENFDYIYEISFSNNTNDTLKVIIDDYQNYSTIFPRDTVNFLGGIKINENEDVVEELLKTREWDSISILEDDEILKTWYKVDASNELHSPFNYNSWNSWLIGNNGVVVFTIQESDLND